MTTTGLSLYARNSLASIIYLNLASLVKSTAFFRALSRACDNITLLIEGPLNQIKKKKKEKGKVSFGKRIKWVFSDTTLVRAWDDYRQTTHVLLMSVWSLLLQLQPHRNALSPLSSYSKTLSSVQYNNYEQGLIRFGPKPQDSTIRANSSPLLIGAVPVGTTCSQDSGSTGLGHGVIDRSKSAGTLGTLSCKSRDNMRDYDPGTGAILARRESDLSRRHRPYSDTKMVWNQVACFSDGWVVPQLLLTGHI